MTTLPRETLDRAVVPWLFAVALATTLPHFGHQPHWLTAASLVTLAAGAWFWWRGQRLPERWLLVFMVIAGCSGVILEYRTILGQDAGVTMLILFMGMKLMELKRRRDAYVVVNLGYFLLLTHYFYSESIGTGLWLIVSMVLVTAALIRLHGSATGAPWLTVRYAGLLVLQALPFMLVLYLLFPRVTGPLWGLPQNSRTAQSGLSDQISPGSIAKLAVNSEIAFRARFDGPPPGSDQLYWRGPVMDAYDGITWRPAGAGGNGPAVEGLTAPTGYEITLEPHDQRWLLALDAPIILPPDAYWTPTMVVINREPVRQRLRYGLASVLGHRFNRQESEVTLRRTTLLPSGRNPRTVALAAEWKKTASTPEELVQRALELFRKEAFTYTLQPPVLGPQPMDDFLFRTRQGFCEHYASAFAVLMRAAGVPARIVAGYQGGELNPVDGYFVVRQSDAHAWAEVWLPKRGWVRVDPTAVVAPSRVQAGRASVTTDESLPGLANMNSPWLRDLRYRWEAANNAWNQWVLGYNPDRQRELLSRLGLPDADWRLLISLLAAACVVMLLAVSAWILYRRPPQDLAYRLWCRALRRLERHRVSSHPWETPLALVERLYREQPELAPPLEAVAQAYCQARYGAEPADLGTLRAALARLP